MYTEKHCVRCGHTRRTHTWGLNSRHLVGVHECRARNCVCEAFLKDDAPGNEPEGAGSGETGCSPPPDSTWEDTLPKHSHKQHV